MEDKKKLEIQKQAKQILDSFAKTLAKVKLKGKANDINSEGFREETNPAKANQDFRMSMFENAPEKDGDCIIAEKKVW